MFHFVLSSKSATKDMAYIMTPAYIQEMRKNGTWAGEPEIIACANKYRVNIHIVTSAERSTEAGCIMHKYKATGEGVDAELMTLYFGHIFEQHYVSLGKNSTVIQNIYIIFIPWVKQSFLNYEDFSNQQNIPKVCMKSYDRKHRNQIKKLRTVGLVASLPRSPPPPPPPPPPDAECQACHWLTPIAKSDWASSTVHVPKAQGNIRMCGDYKRVNEMIKDDGYKNYLMRKIYLLNLGTAWSCKCSQLFLDEISAALLVIVAKMNSAALSNVVMWVWIVYSLTNKLPKTKQKTCLSASQSQCNAEVLDEVFGKDAEWQQVR